MTDKQSSEDMASLAGRILAGGNPLENEQVLAALGQAVAEAGSFDEPGRFNFDLAILEKRLSDVLGNYFENMLALAGSVLSQAPDPAPEPTLETALAEQTEVLDDELARFEANLLGLPPTVAMISLLKGMHPAGTTWAHLAVAIDAQPDTVRNAIHELVAGDLVRRDNSMVFASLKAMSDAEIKPLPWPARRSLP